MIENVVSEVTYMNIYAHLEQFLAYSRCLVNISWEKAGELQSTAITEDVREEFKSALTAEFKSLPIFM